MALTIIDALAPLVAEARGLAELRGALTSTYPAADSQAMAERVEDARLADSWSGQPVTDAQNYALMLVHVVEDHLECICRLLDRPDFAPVWGLGPPARALLEAAGRGAGLVKQGLGARGRVEAYMNERLFALDQISNLPAGAKDGPAICAQRQEILDSAERKGFHRRPHHDPARAALGALSDPPQLGLGRLRDRDVVRRLFEATPELGKGTFQWFSATAHATAWEVEKPFRATGTNALGMVSVELGRSPTEVYQSLNAAVLGYTEVTTRFFMLWGVREIQWRKAALNSIRISRSVASVIAGSAST